MTKISDTTREAVLEALRVFDDQLRGTPEWRGWEDWQSYKYSLQFEGRVYPVKQIVSLATGTPVSEFSGGKGAGQANQVVAKLGFEVVDLHRRNPDWSRDELILALDLYLCHRAQPPGKDSPEVAELSELLNRLDQSLGVTGDATLRNPNGVYMKLMNFRRLDPEYTAEGRVGLPRGGHADEAVWQEFAADPARCHWVAEAIQTAVGGKGGVPPMLDDAIDDIEEANEGRVLTVQHRRRERNRKLVDKKKAAELRVTGHLACQVCGFDFAATYGERGEGFIECHHTLPVSQLAGEKTRLADLALVCANCHRMIHAKRPWLTVEQLREVVRG